MNQYSRLESEAQAWLHATKQAEGQAVDPFRDRLRQYRTEAMDVFEAMGLVGVALPQEDTRAIHAEAMAAGVPYQALIASILHRYVTGHLVEKPLGT